MKIKYLAIAFSIIVGGIFYENVEGQNIPQFNAFQKAIKTYKRVCKQSPLAASQKSNIDIAQKFALLKIEAILFSEDDESWYFYLFPDTVSPSAILKNVDGRNIYYMWVEVSVDKKTGAVDCDCDLMGELEQVNVLQSFELEKLMRDIYHETMQRVPNIEEIQSGGVYNLKFHPDLLLVIPNIKRKNISELYLGCNDIVVIDKTSKSIIYNGIAPCF